VAPARSSLVRAGFLAALVVACGTALPFLPGLKEGLAAFLDWVKNLGPWGPVVLAAAYVPAAVFLVFLSAGALVAGAGFVAGFSITRMFGVEPERLSEKPEPAPEPPPAEPEPVEEPPPPRREDPPVLVEPLPRTDHPLDVARGRLESGDVIGARRAATDYLLVRDALSEEDLRRTAQAYALLADSIRAEVERVERSGGRP